MTKPPLSEQPLADSYRAGSTVFIYRNLRSHYNEIFDGFDAQDFCGFNPLFPAEAEVTREAIGIHLNRLQSPMFGNSKYLFFDSSGLRRADCFFRSLYEQTSARDALGRVQLAMARDGLKDSDWVSAGKMTYFVGTCGVTPKCVVYLYDKSEDEPVSVLVYMGNLAMHRILTTHFDSLWSKQRQVERVIDRLGIPAFGSMDGRPRPPAQAIVPTSWASVMARVIEVVFDRVCQVELEHPEKQIRIECLRVVSVELERRVGGDQARHVGLLLAMWWLSTSPRLERPNFDRHKFAPRRIAAVRWYLEWVKKSEEWPDATAKRGLKGLGGPVHEWVGKSASDHDELIRKSWGAAKAAVLLGFESVEG